MLKTFVLAMTVIMPSDRPDITRTKPMSSLDECWDAARDFVAHNSLTDEMRAHGALGFGASCAAIEKPGENN